LNVYKKKPVNTFNDIKNRYMYSLFTYTTINIDIAFQTHT